MTCPHCKCQNSVAHFGCYICDCCGIWFTSEEAENPASPNLGDFPGTKDRAGELLSRLSSIVKEK
jgi:hypothetical protein